MRLMPLRTPTPASSWGFRRRVSAWPVTRRSRQTARTSRSSPPPPEDKKPIPWVRVYQLPKYVYFSHRVHAAGRHVVRDLPRTGSRPRRDRQRGGARHALLHGVSCRVEGPQRLHGLPRRTLGVVPQPNDRLQDLGGGRLGPGRGSPSRSASHIGRRGRPRPATMSIAFPLSSRVGCEGQSQPLNL